MLINISAQAGQGKTTQLFWEIKNNLIDGKRVAFITTELTPEDAIYYLDGVRIRNNIKFCYFYPQYLTYSHKSTSEILTVLNGVVENIDRNCPNPDIIALDGSGFSNEVILKYFMKMYPKATIIYTSQLNAFGDIR